MTRFRITALFGWLCWLLVTSLASAQTQPWLADRRIGEGAGIRAGDLELHPGIAAEWGYDSNFFLAAGEDPNLNLSEPIISATRLRVTPSLSLRTLGAERQQDMAAHAARPKAAFGLTGFVGYNKLSALDETYADVISNQSYVDSGANTTIEILPYEPWSVSLGASFLRTEQPSNDPGALNAAFDRNRYAGHLDVRWRPGGGALTWSMGYAGSVTRFDNTPFALSRAEHGFRTRGLWRFLPRTSLVYEGEIGFIQQLNTVSRQTDAAPISSQLGINGLITERLGILAMAGMKAMFFEPGQSGALEDFNGTVGRAELSWYPGAAPDPGTDGPSDVGWSRVRAGYLRDVLPGAIGNFYELNRLFADAAFLIGGVAIVTARSGIAFVQHSFPRDVDGTPLVTDAEGPFEWRPELNLFGEYRLTGTIAIIGSLEVTASPNDNFILVERSTGLNDNLRFSRFVALFGARWFL